MHGNRFERETICEKFKSMEFQVADYEIIAKFVMFYFSKMDFIVPLEKSSRENIFCIELNINYLIRK